MLAWWSEWKLSLLQGAAAWAAVSGAAGLYALFAEKPPVAIVLTVNEWAAAFLILPWLLSGGRSAFQRAPVAAGGADSDTAVAASWRAPGVILAARIGLVIFLMDLLIRLIFKLGWKPLLF
jgi:hypothetical protein